MTLARTRFATLFATALLCGSAPMLATAAPGDATVRLEVTGVRNASGDVGCMIFSAPEGYPEDHGKALREKHARIEAGRAVCEFEQLALRPTLRYADLDARRS